MIALTVSRSSQRGGHRGEDPDAAPWTGPKRPYDLVKELVVCLLAVSLLSLVLAAVFSSPDEKQITIGEWAQKVPNDFVATAATELDGTSATATYGAPYTHDASAAQKIGPLAPQNWPGVTTPINTAREFVLGPLKSAGGTAEQQAALGTFTATSTDQQQKWATAYDEALAKVGGDQAKVPAGDYGPVPVMLGNLLALAQSGGLDGVLLSEGHFYQTDYTRPLLFLADGTYLEDRSVAQHLGGDQWGMMNETGNYPGQAWLWLYTVWYQIKPFSTSGNADALVWTLVMVLTLLFVLLPFIPGLRSVPRLVPVHRLIWRHYYRNLEASTSGR